MDRFVDAIAFLILVGGAIAVAAAVIIGVGLLVGMPWEDVAAAVANGVLIALIASRGG